MKEWTNVLLVRFCYADMPTVLRLFRATRH